MLLLCNEQVVAKAQWTSTKNIKNSDSQGRGGWLLNQTTPIGPRLQRLPEPVPRAAPRSVDLPLSAVGKSYSHGVHGTYIKDHSLRCGSTYIDATFYCFPTSMAHAYAILCWFTGRYGSVHIRSFFRPVLGVRIRLMDCEGARYCRHFASGVYRPA